MPGKLKYDTYHKEFTGAMQHAYAVVKKQGYKVDDKSIYNDVTTGPKKPGKGKTNEYHLKLSGKKQRLHIQVYNTGPKYELNMYIEETDMTDLDKFITLLEAYDCEKPEATIHISNELFNEAVKAGKGSIKNVDINLDASDYDGGEKQYIKDVKKRFKVTIKLHRNGAYLTGKKANIIQFLLSDMYGGVGEDDIEDMWPELLETFSNHKFITLLEAYDCDCDDGECGDECDCEKPEFDEKVMSISTRKKMGRAQKKAQKKGSTKSKKKRNKEKAGMSDDQAIAKAKTKCRNMFLKKFNKGEAPKTPAEKMAASKKMDKVITPKKLEGCAKKQKKTVKKDHKLACQALKKAKAKKN